MLHLRHLALAALIPLSALSSCAPDRIASALTGQDCNSAYLYDDESFCKKRVRPPPQPYCTTGFEGTDCWARPDLMPNLGTETYEGATHGRAILMPLPQPKKP
nr:hypothetical protein [uncultured Neokomagataea sp.]